MSEATDEARREDAREAADLRSGEILAKLARLRALWRERLPDEAIAARLGWSRSTVLRWRRRLEIRVGLPTRREEGP